MNVKELITSLLEYPMDSPVEWQDDTTEYYDSEIQKVTQDGESPVIVIHSGRSV